MSKIAAATIHRHRARHPPSSSKLKEETIIDLTTDSEDEHSSDIEVIAANISSDIEIVYDADEHWSDREIIEPRAGPSTAGKVVLDDLGEDEKLARQLQEEEERRAPHADGAPAASAALTEDEKLAEQLQEEERLHAQQALPKKALAARLRDERMAKKLAEQEEAQFTKLIESVEKKQEGIVFNVVVDAATNTLEDGSPAHPDDLARFGPWRTLFEQSGMKVKKFHWVVNYELEKRFEEARKALELLTGEPPREHQMFHGTRAENIDSILKGGFRIGGMGTHKAINGAALGYGIYLASAAMTSLGYAAGANRIFACRVLPGRTTSDRRYSSQVPKGVEVGSEQFESFSATVGMDRFNVLVMRYASLVLPCYMIEFEQQYNGLMGGLPLIGMPLGGVMAGIVYMPPPLAPPRPPLVPLAVPRTVGTTPIKTKKTRAQPARSAAKAKTQVVGAKTTPMSKARAKGKGKARATPEHILDGENV